MLYEVITAVVAAPPSAARPDGYSTAPTANARTEMGWDVAPQGLRRVLGFIAERWPVRALYVTENGAAYPDAEIRDGRARDVDRIEYYRGHIRITSYNVCYTKLLRSLGRRSIVIGSTDTRPKRLP